MGARTRQDAARRAERLARLAIGAAVLGLIGTLPIAVSGLLAGCVLTFVAVGPGCLALRRAHIDAVTTIVLAPLCGLALIILVTTAEAFAGFWHPKPTLAVLAAGTLVLALPHLWSQHSAGPGD